MGAIFYFDPEMEGKLRGSSFCKPDGTEHDVALFEDDGHMVLRVRLAGSSESVDFLFSAKHAVAFGSATEAALSRLGLRKDGRNNATGYR